MPGLVPPLLTAAGFFTGEQPVLRGDGLVLRPWRLADAAAVARAYQDLATQRWHLQTLTPEEAADWVQARARRWVQHTGADWAVVADGDGDGDGDGATVLGRMGFHHFELGQGLGEIAYWTVPEARGQRVAPRALGVLSRWSFTEAGMHRLELNHSVQNPASCRVAEQAGFVCEGVKRGELRHADGWHDMHLHARLASD